MLQAALTQLSDDAVRHDPPRCSSERLVYEQQRFELVAPEAAECGEKGEGPTHT